MHVNTMKWPNGAKCALLVSFDFDAETLWLAREADKNMEKNRAEVSKMPGHTVAKLPAAEYAKLQEMMKPVYDEWKKRTPGGEEVLKALGK